MIFSRRLLMNRKKPSKNLFNAKTGRVIKERVGSYDPSGIRSNMDGTGIHIGLGYSNYYIPSMVKAYEIFDDNSLTLTSSSDYGVAFEFILEPSEKYCLSFERVEGKCAVWALAFNEDGKYLATQLLASDAADGSQCVFTADINARYTVINFLHYGSTVTTSTIKNIQLEKGNFATEFEPYR